MNTASYIKMLSRDPRRLTYKKAKTLLMVKLFAGFVLGVVLVLSALGIRPDWRDALGSVDFWLKQAFPTAVAFLAARELIRSAYPVPYGKSWFPFIFLLFVAVEVLGVWSLLNAGHGAYLGSLLGSTWRHCSYRIVWVGLPSMVLAFWAIKQLAPGDLGRAGTYAGLFGGAVGATVYALHCSEKTAPFVAVWYVVGMAVPTIVGRIVGPRVLRW